MEGGEFAMDLQNLVWGDRHISSYQLSYLTQGQSRQSPPPINHT